MLSFHKKYVCQIINFAVNRFLNTDKELLENNVNERSLTHKFAEYIQDEVNSSWFVDCEYNRYGNDPKEIDEIKQIVGEIVSTDSLEPKTVYPDIIVHKRGSEGPNWIVIEAKKNASNKERDDDIKKLGKIKKRYKYSYAIFINFDTINKSINWEFVK